MRFLNIVGPQIRRLRYQRGWSQAHLAVKLQLKGWDISRGGVAKIESKIHEVSDTELLYLARVLNVPLAELYPPINDPLHDALQALLTPKPKPQLVPPTEQPLMTSTASSPS